MDNRAEETLVALRADDRFVGIRARFEGKEALLMRHLEGCGVLELLAELRETPVTHAHELLNVGVLSAIHYFLDLEEPDRSQLLELITNLLQDPAMPTFMAAAMRPHLDGQVEDMQTDPVALELHAWCRRLIAAHPERAPAMRKLVTEAASAWTADTVRVASLLREWLEAPDDQGLDQMLRVTRRAYFDLAEARYRPLLGLVHDLLAEAGHHKPIRSAGSRTIGKLTRDIACVRGADAFGLLLADAPHLRNACGHDGARIDYRACEAVLVNNGKELRMDMQDLVDRLGDLVALVGPGASAERGLVGTAAGWTRGYLREACEHMFTGAQEKRTA